MGKTTARATTTATSEQTKSRFLFCRRVDLGMAQANLFHSRGKRAEEEERKINIFTTSTN